MYVWFSFERITWWIIITDHVIMPPTMITICVTLNKYDMMYKRANVGFISTCSVWMKYDIYIYIYIYIYTHSNRKFTHAFARQSTNHKSTHIAITSTIEYHDDQNSLILSCLVFNFDFLEWKLDTRCDDTILINGKCIARYKLIVKLTIISHNKCVIKYFLFLQNTI